MDAPPARVVAGVGPRRTLTGVMVLTFFSVGCGEPDCPSGTSFDGARCKPIDASVDAEGSDGGDVRDASVDSPGCTATVEICDGEDNDCDGRPDQTFACVAGATSVRCVTACGSTGAGECGTDCTVASCIVPPEACTYADDDCDGLVDEGLTGFGSAIPFDPTLATTVRVEATTDGYVAIVNAEGTLYGQRFSPEGTLEAPSASLASGAMTFMDTAVSDDRLVVAWAATDGIRATVLATADLSTLVSERVIPGSAGFFAGHVAVEQSDSHVLFAYLRGTDVRALTTDPDLEAIGTEQTLATYTGPGRKFDLLAPSNGSLDWILAYVSGSVAGDVYLQRVRPGSGRAGIERNVTNSPSVNETGPVLADDGRGVLGLAWNAEAVLELALHRQSDFVAITDNAGGSLPPPGADVFRALDIAFSADRWIITHLAGGRRIAARVFSSDAMLVGGSDGSPIAFETTSDPTAVGMADLAGQILVITTSTGQNEGAVLGCTGS